MSNTLVRVTDLTDGTRAAVVDSETAPVVVGHWLSADGIGAPSRNVEALARALSRGDWAAVHSIADRLSVSVEPVEAPGLLALPDDQWADALNAAVAPF